ncbi:MAG: hypothetical protein Q9225_001685 [Loekoesia sp. 1 TL-2023]
MSDLEGDSRMQSSSEGSEDDLDAMFPKANEPPDTAQPLPASNIQNLQQYSELSPPSSEDPTDSRTLGHEPMDQINGAEGLSAKDSFSGESALNAPQQQLSIADREPGASWNTRKQKDDEDRVKEHLLDKGFGLSTCPQTESHFYGLTLE